MNWIRVKDKFPDEGQLCIVYFPIGQNNLTGKTVGQSATAYFRANEGFVYADLPTKIRFKPFYWMPFNIEGIPISNDIPKWRVYDEV